MKFAIYFLLFLFLCIFPQNVLAHFPGQQPFFKIDDVYTPLYPVPSTSLTDFVLPQDISPKAFIVGEPIEFAIDTTQLPMVSEEALQDMKFQWDFGNTALFEGLETTYAYPKMGSYILQIFADDGSTPVLMQSVLINILPDKEYVLPKAVILVNGKQSTDPLSEPLLFSFADMLLFDGSKSTSSNDITSYFWDFGDMSSSKQKKVGYLYKDDLRIVFPVLRITDKNGFISDAFIQVDNTAYENMTDVQNDKKKESNALYIFGIGVIVIIGVIIVTMIKYRKNKAKERI